MFSSAAARREIYRRSNTTFASASSQEALGELAASERTTKQLQSSVAVSAVGIVKTIL
jgi:hypothetical protein